MAARDQRNLRKHNNRLYQQTWRAVETYVPKRVDGRKGVVGLSYSGPDSKNISSMCFLQCFRYRREVPSTMPMKRTLLWWTFSLEDQLPLVKIHLLKNIKFHTFPQSLRDPKEWPGSTSSLTWEVSVVFALASALCLLLSSHIGS